MAHDAAGGGIEALVRAHGVLLDEVPQRERGREGVAELDDAEGSDDGDEAEEVGDRGRDDEGHGPVDGHDDRPEDLALLGGEGREAEQVHEDVVVQDLDADVAVQARGDDPAEDGEHVAGCLPAVGADPLVGDLVGIPVWCE